MKTVGAIRPAVLALVLAAAGCAGSKPAVQAPPAPYPAIPAQFTETPMMLSSRSVDTATLNVEIGAAARRNEDWVEDPSLIAMHFAKAAAAPRVRLYRADNRSESPDSSTVTVIMDHLLDDSVNGVWTQYTMTRNADGSWRVAALRQATKAYRGPDTENYRAEPAP
jgi:hypothetical protein